MQEHIEKPMYSEALLERMRLGRPDLVNSLQDPDLKVLYKIASTVYAIEDGASIAFSSLKAAYSLKASFEQRSDDNAQSEWHASELTLDGLVTTIGVSLFLMGFLGLGTYFTDDDDLDKNLFKYYLVKLSPYIRDVLQAVKWTYKGLRSCLNVIFHFLGHAEVVLKLLFPLSLAFAALAVLNRIFIRTIRNERKELQKNNRAMSQEIFDKSCGLYFKEKLPDTDKLSNFNNSFIYIVSDLSSEVYFVTDNVAHKVDIDINEVDELLQCFQSDNLCKKLSLDFTSQEYPNLFFLEEISGNLEEYKSSLVYLVKSDETNEAGLYEIDAHGKMHLSSKNQAFCLQLEIERKNKRTLALFPSQIDALLGKIESLQDFHKVNFTHNDWINYEKSLNSVYELSIRKRALSYMAVALASVLDASYFYIGALFIVALNPSFFIAMLGLSLVLFVCCFAARIYEEYDYQRVYEVTRLEVELAKNQAECRILIRELENKLLDDDRKQYLLNLLSKALKEYDSTQRKIEKKVVFSIYSAVLQGLRNGLAVQGVISGLMFLGATIMMLCGVPCPAIFIIAMISASLLCLIFFVARYVHSYLEYRKHVEPLALIEISNNAETPIPEQITSLVDIKNMLDNRILRKPPNHSTIEYSELVRLGPSGFVKAQKNFYEFTYRFSNKENSLSLFIISMLFSVAMAGIFVIRTVKKMFSDQVDNSVIPENKKLKATNKNSFFSTSNQAEQPNIVGNVSPSP